MENYNTPMNGFYNFTPELAFKTIEEHWRGWDRAVRPTCYVVGISGGIDSTCVAALAAKIFGKERIVGISLPCDGQSDMWAVDQVFAALGIKRITIDIGDMFNLGVNAIENNAIEINDVCRTNMPARLRMTMLYGVAQSLNGCVLNTCNRSEDVVGYATLYGDNAGSYAPISKLTKTEVKAMSKWLGLPDSLVDKVPIDGLQPLTDEQKLGITYAKIDDYIRSTGPVTEEEKKLIVDKYLKNKFKLEIVHIPGPDFGQYPDALRASFGV